MAIQALPLTAVRAIGASQTLTDSACLAKELIDNALDAKAQAVTVEISADTLAVIQVRDNGHGIAPEDRSVIARRYCTSKITSEDDLVRIGGSSLGFRGEALSSAAEMSGSMTVTTRVKGEQVATALKIGQNGEVVSKERGSLPIGTTVRITEFVKTNPVRKQQALANTEKTLKKVKQILQAYAFVRPDVRLSLKVLKAKNDKGDFMYAPKAGADAKDASFKIVGSACAQQCTWSAVEHAGFTLQAFLPRPDADPAKVSNVGAFVSIDGRPMASTRGTLKELIKMFRESLKKADPSFERAKEPFLYLDIQCPAKSYDVNVEPAKDGVVFAEPSLVSKAARTLFDALYPFKDTANEPRADAGPAARTMCPSMALNDEDDIFTSLGLEDARRRAETLVSPDLGNPCSEDRSRRAQFGADEDLTEPPAKRHCTFRLNMYGCDEDEFELLDQQLPTGPTEANFTELARTAVDMASTRRWATAKMNAAIRNPMTTSNGGDLLLGSAPDLRKDDVPMILPVRDPRLRPEPPADGLPTPRPSSPWPFHGPPHSLDNVPMVMLAKGIPIGGAPSLPSPQSCMALPTTSEGYEASSPARQSQQQPAYDYALSSRGADRPSGTPLHAIPDASQRLRRSPGKRQSRQDRQIPSSPFNGNRRENVWFDHLEKHARRQNQGHHFSRNIDAGNCRGLIVRGEIGELLEDPRPLAPPSRNRDIRDFLGSPLEDEQTSAAKLLERRNFPKSPRRLRACSIDSTMITQPELDDKNSTVWPHSILGFMPASELPIVETHLQPLAKARKSVKRRRITESPAPSETIGNGTVIEDNNLQSLATTRTVSRRQHTSTVGLHRTKSSCLPLERVPKGKGMHNVLLSLNVSAQEISSSVGKVEVEWSLLGWKKLAFDAYNVFAHTIDLQDVNHLAKVLRELLVNRISDDEMVQDLSMAVRNGLARHWEGIARDGAISAV